MNILASYINGNSQVVIYSDGTKERTYEGNLVLDHPESMDVKITNWCDAGCAYCHEQSTTAGKHADLSKLLGVLEAMPAGVECAIGGGHALSHPDVIPFLEELKNRGIIANMTINQKHIKRDQDLLVDCLERSLIKGLGISFTDNEYLEDFIPILKATNNIVFHIINGVSDSNCIKVLQEFCKANNRDCKILILGYKNYGRGKVYLNNKHIKSNMQDFYMRIGGLLGKSGLTLSFDNLAIDQLNLRRFFTDKAWETFYMGKEGSHSMYIDAVEQKYALTSASGDRKSFDDISLIEFFNSIKGD